MRTKAEIIQSNTATNEELYRLGLVDGENSFMDLTLVGQADSMRGYRTGLQGSEYKSDYCAN